MKIILHALAYHFLKSLTHLRIFAVRIHTFFSLFTFCDSNSLPGIPQISPYCSEQKLQIILSIAAIESPLSFDSLLTVSIASDTVAVSWLPVPIRYEPRNLLKWTSGFAPSIPTFRRYSQHRASPIFRSLYFDL